MSGTGAGCQALPGTELRAADRSREMPPCPQELTLQQSRETYGWWGERACGGTEAGEVLVESGSSARPGWVEKAGKSRWCQASGPCPGARLPPAAHLLCAHCLPPVCVQELQELERKLEEELAHQEAAQLQRALAGWQPGAGDGPGLLDEPEETDSERQVSAILQRALSKRQKLLEHRQQR